MLSLKSYWLSQIGDRSREANAIRARQVVSLSKQTPLIAAGNLVCSAMTLVVFWNLAPRAGLLGWTALIWLAAFARLRRWLRNRHRPMPTEMSRRPLIRSIVWSLLAGGLWGSAGILFFTPDSLGHQVFLAFVIGGMAAASVATMSAFPLACAAYVVPSLLPLIVVFATQNPAIPLTMATFLTLYCLGLLLTVQNAYGGFVDTVRAKLENEALLDELAEAHEKLEVRVAERTAELGYSEQRFAKAFQASPSLMVITGIEDGRFYDVNDNWVSTMGYSREEALGRTAFDLGVWIDPNDRARLLATLEEEGGVRDLEIPFRTKGGEVRDFLVAVEKIELDGGSRLLFVSHDITERKATEEQFRQAQKMEAVGQLTGGIAHDFNNLLAIVLGNLELLDEGLEGDPESRALARNAMSAAERGARLTRRLGGRVPRHHVGLPAGLRRLCRSQHAAPHRRLRDAKRGRSVDDGDVFDPLLPRFAAGRAKRLCRFRRHGEGEARERGAAR